MSFSHAPFEKNTLLLIIGVLIVVSIGGLVQIVPQIVHKGTIEKIVEANANEKKVEIRPYTPLELAGRDIYVREGCYTCHSQMIRSLKSDVIRYGHYSLAAESMYDHPFQWGSKRTGPDLARVGVKNYSDDWHVSHLINPRAFEERSIMPGYPFLMRKLNYKNIAQKMKVQKIEGVPYSDEMIANAKSDLESQLDPDSDGVEGLEARYGKVKIRNFNPGNEKITEMDALVAYLQMLGTLVDFDKFNSKSERNIR